MVKAAGLHADAVSFNWYGSWTPDSARMRSWEGWAGKPFIITEWYAKGGDAAGLANTSGAGWLVKTQADRGRFYQNFALGLLRAKGCVGWHWFKYQDNDPQAGGDPSNQDSNKGIVDIAYQPYGELVEAMRALNAEAYSLTEFFDGRAWSGLKGGGERAVKTEVGGGGLRLWAVPGSGDGLRDARGRYAPEAIGN